MFSNALRVIGWSHTWGNIVKQVACSFIYWPQMETRIREQLAFWRNKSWRKHLRKCLQHVDAQIDCKCLDPQPPTMAK